jgi:nucleoside-diphosphate-sugar epimerase
MHVFVTGATGFVGGHVVRELISAGHQVTGLCRDPAKAQALLAAGAVPYLGTLEDLDGLKSAAAQADGIIHLGFNHDFARFAQSCDDDRAVIAALGSAVAGTGRPLLVTSGTMMANTVAGAPAREDGAVLDSAHHPRAASEEAAAALTAGGVNISVIRLPQVHDVTRAGLVAVLLQTAQQAGFLAYVEDGANRWSAGHVHDVARLYRLAIEKAAPGAIYHAAHEEGVSLRDISETLGNRLNLPTRSLSREQAADHFGWFALLAGMDAPATSDLTRQALGWQPMERGLLADLAAFEISAT